MAADLEAHLTARLEEGPPAAPAAGRAAPAAVKIPRVVGVG